MHTSAFPAEAARWVLDFGVPGMLSEAALFVQSPQRCLGRDKAHKAQSSWSCWTRCCHSSSDELIKSGNWTHFALLSRSAEEFMAMRSPKAASNTDLCTPEPSGASGPWTKDFERCVKGGCDGWAEELGFGGVWIKSKSKFCCCCSSGGRTWSSRDVKAP